MINKKHLCNTCLTGRETLRYDAYSQMCPYISCVENGKCSMYKEIERKKGWFVSFFSRLFKICRFK